MATNGADEGPSGSSTGTTDTPGAVTWSWSENKLFEILLVEILEKEEDEVEDHHWMEKWNKLASQIPGKTAKDVIDHYKKLVVDVENIANGSIPCPEYTDAFAKRSRTEKRRSGVPWTEEEHKKFLLGLRKYGKGAWKVLSREFVMTRTPQQIASHAQKYFKHQAKEKGKRVRPSIHDTKLDQDEEA